MHGLSCVVELEDRKIVVDLGVALGYRRHGLLPRPAQVAVGEQVRRRILAEVEDATDVAMGHFHGDHVPLLTTIPETLRTDPSSRKEDQHGDGLQIGTEMEQTLGGIRLTALASGTG